MATAAVILAAGQGKRMRSSLPKILHPAADMPLVGHVVALAEASSCSPIVVVVDPVGRPKVEDTLKRLFPTTALTFATQHEPLGTGDALKAGLGALTSHAGNILVLCGDVPLLSVETIAKLEPALQGVDLAMLTARVPDPTGYGRIVRESDTKMRIVEHRDATEAERAINEINVAVYLCGMELMRATVNSLTANNAQGELYLTEIAVTASKGRGVRAVDVADLDEMRGVNDQAQLAEVDALMRDKLVRMHQNHGVRFKDPKNVYPSARLSCGHDVVIGVGVQFQGAVTLGNGVVVEGPSVLRECVVGDGTTIEAFSHIDGATIGKNAKIGPSARLRPGAALADDVHIGNFVEVKNSTMAKGAKANHLAYLGDADIGARTNIGAGTITCNYDGVAKHRTTIGAGVFVGSNSTLVAPVTIEDQAYVAAGSTINKTVPADALAFGRARQENRDGYAKKLREHQKAKKGE